MIYIEFYLFNTTPKKYKTETLSYKKDNHVNNWLVWRLGVESLRAHGEWKQECQELKGILSYTEL